MVRAGVSGGAPKYEAVPEPDGPHKIYGVEPKYRQRIETVMNPQTRENTLLSSQDYMGTDPRLILVGVVERLASTRTAYLKQVEKLSKDAAAHFADLTALPARAQVPPIADDLSFTQLIASDAVKGKNLVIGAQPGSIASKQLLINHLDTLVESGFKRLYVEYLAADVFKAKLEKNEQGKSWKHIEKHLEAVDRALGHEQDAPFSYLALVRTAREKGLKIHALDASTSYKLEGALVLDEVSPLTPRSNSLRNFYSHKTLAADIADAPDERWVILTEQSRMSTFDNTPAWPTCTRLSPCAWRMSQRVRRHVSASIQPGQSPGIRPPRAIIVCNGRRRTRRLSPSPGQQRLPRCRAFQRVRYPALDARRYCANVASTLRHGFTLQPDRTE